MRRPRWPLVLGGVASVTVAIVLAVPRGPLGGTTQQEEAALSPAPDFDVCAMLDDLLGERTGTSPALVREDDVPVNATLELRHPHRSRRGCTLSENDLDFGDDEIRLREVELTVTTMADTQAALDRAESALTRVVSPIGPGALTDVGEDRASMSNFLAEDHDSWQSFQQYVVGPHHVVLFFRFRASDQQIEPRQVVDYIDGLVDVRVDPDDYAPR